MCNFNFFLATILLDTHKFSDHLSISSVDIHIVELSFFSPISLFNIIDLYTCEIS